MEISISEETVEAFRETARRMLESGENRKAVDEDNNFFIVRDGTPECSEYPDDGSSLFYSFEEQGIIFHVAMN